MPPKKKDDKKKDAGKDDAKKAEEEEERELVEKELVIGYLRSKLNRFVRLRFHALKLLSHSIIDSGCDRTCDAHALSMAGRDGNCRLMNLRWPT